MEYTSNKNDERYHDLCSKCDALLLADVFEKFTNSRLKNQKIKDYVQVVIWMHQL